MTVYDLLNDDSCCYTENRIDKRYKLSCKGVHSDISNDEAEQCFIKTYFLIADILRLADGDSAILRDNE